MELIVYVLFKLMGERWLWFFFPEFTLGWGLKGSANYFIKLNWLSFSVNFLSMIIFCKLFISWEQNQLSKTKHLFHKPLQWQKPWVSVNIWKILDTGLLLFSLCFILISHCCSLLHLFPSMPSLFPSGQVTDILRI